MNKPHIYFSNGKWKYKRVNEYRRSITDKFSDDIFNLQAYCFCVKLNNKND